MRYLLITLVMFFIGLSLFGQVPAMEAMVVFRDAVFGQNISVAEAQRLYQDAQRQAHESLTGSALNAALSRCEYFMGRVYQDHSQNNEAVSRYEAGVSLAERSIAQGANAAAYVMIASNVGQLCMIKSTAWVMFNGSKVEDNARRALRLDSRNAGALYLLASRWAFGPGIFGDPGRGVTELEAILNGQADMQKDDYFNVYSALSYACNRLNRNNEALSWIQMALTLYPTNRFALDLQSEIQQKLRAAR